jgi:hypothetical protein
MSVNHNMIVIMFRRSIPTPGPPCNKISGRVPLDRSPKTLYHVRHSFRAPSTAKGILPLLTGTCAEAMVQKLVQRDIEVASGHVAIKTLEVH